MNSTFQLTYAPEPKSEESLRGYFERLNHINGMKGAQNLCDKLKTTYLPQQARPFSKKYNNYFINLAPALRMKPEELAGYFYNQSNINYFREINLTNTAHLYHKDFRFCPLCLADDLYMRHLWDTSLVTACPFHQCNLQSECPHCHEKLKWNTWKLNECRKCGESLIETPIVTQCDKYSMMVSRLFLEANNNKYIEALLLATQRMHRPFDNMLSTPKLETYAISRIQQLVHLGLGLLHSSSFRHSYFVELKHRKATYRDISIESVLEPWANFNSVCQFQYDDSLPEISFFTRDIEAFDEGISTSRLTTYKKQNELSLSHQISANRLASLIGLDLDSINSLVEHNVLVPLTVARKGRSPIFDMNALAEQFCELEIHQVPSSEELIHFHELKRVLVLFTASPRYIYELILNGKLKLYCPGEHRQLKHCYLNEQDLYKALQAQLYEHEQSVTGTALASIFFSHLTLIKRLEAVNLFEANHWSNEYSVEGHEFHKFINKYICLNRVSYFANVPEDTLLDGLQMLGIDPVFQESFRGKQLILLSNSQSIRLTLHKLIENLKGRPIDKYIGF